MLTPKSSANVNKDEYTSKQITALLDFSLAEYGSGIEMAQAAKRVDDVRLAAGFLRHACDEYRHMGIFRQIAHSAGQRKSVLGLTPYLPRNVTDKRYIDPQLFLFEKKSFGHFAVFVLTNERYASHNLANIITEGTIFIADEINQLKCIMKDEERHIGFAGSFVETFRNEHPFKARGLAIWERLDLMRRNIQSRSQGIYNFLSRIIVSVGLWIFIILTRSIGNDWSCDHGLKPAVKNAERMF
jgi:hypothetical protein